MAPYRRDVGEVGVTYVGDRIFALIFCWVCVVSASRPMFAIIIENVLSEPSQDAVFFGSLIGGATLASLAIWDIVRNG